MSQPFPPTFERKIPDGDTSERMVCGGCGWVHYENPKVIVGAVVTWEDRILMCRRAIQPRRGFWTLPAGYMEAGETSTDGARREAFEEACVEIEIDGLLAVYNIPRLSQVQLIYRAHLTKPEFAPGPESLDVQLFRWEEIPWSEISFPSVRWALNHFKEMQGRDVFVVGGNPPGEMGDY